MGGGISHPEAKSEQVITWSVRVGQNWEEYEDQHIQLSLTNAFFRGEDTVSELTTSNGVFCFDIYAMVEIEVETMKRRDLRCQYSGDNAPRRPKPSFDTDDIDEFESRMLSFLVSNKLRFSDIFHEIDHDRNGWLTRWEVHTFFTHNIWTHTNPEVTKHIFALMEHGGDIGRVSFHSFCTAVEELKRVNAFESLSRSSSVRYKGAALKQSRAAIAASPAPSPSASPSSSFSSSGNMIIVNDGRVDSSPS
jgi:hypothetical protein